MEKYHEMSRCGILNEDDRVELLEGWIVEKMTKSPLHRIVTHALRKILERSLTDGYYVDSQEPVSLAMSEPEPDAVVIRGDSDDFGDHHPCAKDIVLIAEIIESSLQRDRVFKRKLYAASAIPVYWIVNRVDRQIEVYTSYTIGSSVAEADYASPEIYCLADSVPLVIDGKKIGDLPVALILN